MDRKLELQKVMDDARIELHAIEDQKRLSENLLLVGKCYKVKNSYGSGDSWWLYRKVVSLSEHYNLNTLEFQTDIYGKIQIEESDAYNLYDGHIEISQEEFYNAWKDLDKTIDNFKME